METINTRVLGKRVIFKDLGQKPAVCKCCGRPIMPFTKNVVNVPEGGKARYICPSCLDGDFNDTVALTTAVGDAKRNSATDRHTIQVVVSQPLVACILKVCHNFTSRKLEGSDDFVCEFSDMGGCWKGAWIFDRNGEFFDGFSKVFVNGQGVENASEYHRVVKAQDWYQRVGE